MIIELSSRIFHTVSPLFAGIQHNIALVHAVLEGSSPGRVFADDSTHPSFALVAMEGAFSYLGGAPASEEDSQLLVDRIFEDLLPNAAEKELVLFAFSEAARTLLEAPLKARGAITIHRKIFDFRADVFAKLDGWRAQIPAGMELRIVDAELAVQHPEFRPLVDPSTKRFGVCLVEGDRILSTCKAVAVGGGDAEIDIFTEESCRSRGLATLTACAFIVESLARGLRPAWSCWPYREGSYRLAKKLGFTERPDAPAFFWAEGMR